MRFTSLLRAAAYERGVEVDWARADVIFADATGMPTEVPLREMRAATP
jgi:hypothetical protein